MKLARILILGSIILGSSLCYADKTPDIDIRLSDVWELQKSADSGATPNRSYSDGHSLLHVGQGPCPECDTIESVAEMTTASTHGKYVTYGTTSGYPSLIFTRVFGKNLTTASAVLLIDKYYVILTIEFLDDAADSSRTQYYVEELSNILNDIRIHGYMDTAK